MENDYLKELEENEEIETLEEIEVQYMDYTESLNDLIVIQKANLYLTTALIGVFIASITIITLLKGVLGIGND